MPSSVYAQSIAVPKSDVPASQFPPLPPSLFRPPAVPVTRRAIHRDLPLGFVLEGVLSRDECAALDAAFQSLGPSFYAPNPAQKAFRSCDTVEVRMDEFAAALFERMRPCLEASELCVNIDRDDDARAARDLMGRWEACSTTDLVLYSRYGAGGHFAAHTDGFNVVGFDHRSLFSIVLYLNDVEPGQGGETAFFAPSAGKQVAADEQGRLLGTAQVLATVRPVAGTACVFYHQILHQSQPTLGTADKRIVRSDVMYKRNPPVLSTERDNEAFALYLEAERMAEDPALGAQASELFRKAFKMSQQLAAIHGS